MQPAARQEAGLAERLSSIRYGRSPWTATCAPPAGREYCARMVQSVYLAALKRARDYAGGASGLSKRIGLSADTLDAMLHEHESIPGWVFIRVLDYINDVESKREPAFWPHENSRAQGTTPF